MHENENIYTTISLTSNTKRTLNSFRLGGEHWEDFFLRIMRYLPERKW